VFKLLKHFTLRAENIGFFLISSENINHNSCVYIEKNSMIRVRERTIPTERPPLVGEAIANFYG
jgi:hypothetical protein